MELNKQSFDIQAKVHWDAGILHGIDKKNFEDWKREYEKDVIRYNVNLLLKALYIPTDNGFKVDHNRCEFLGVNTDEPINWGDLHISDITATEYGFDVIIEEAAPDECPSLCDYICTYMDYLGWDLEVGTEW